MKSPALILTALSVFAIASSSAEVLPLKLVYNGSPSAPAGFYRVDQTPANHGDYVLIEPPDWLRSLIAKREYLPPGIPLIKSIAATKGDVVCRWNNRIFINGNFAATAKTTDKNGWQLPRWQGCQRLQDHQVFLLQPHPMSFDSRYFGIIDRSRIIGRAAKLGLPSWN